MSQSSNDDVFRPLTEEAFHFNCHKGIACFTECCAKLRLILTPYDILRIKNRLKVQSDEFLEKYTNTDLKIHSRFPMVVLKMNEDTKRCPFVSESGCSVYTDRPWPCRMFPLDMNDDGTFRLITDSSLCKGLNENEKLRISEWLVGQGVPIYDEVNTLFSEVTNPLRAQTLDIDNPKIHQMIFMSLYNLDKFREFIFKSTFLDRFELDKTKLEKLKRSDLELLKFAFDWIKFGIFGQKTLQVKSDAIPKSDKDA